MTQLRTGDFRKRRQSKLLSPAELTEDMKESVFYCFFNNTFLYFCFQFRLLWDSLTIKCSSYLAWLYKYPLNGNYKFGLKVKINISVCTNFLIFSVKSNHLVASLFSHWVRCFEHQLSVFVYCSRQNINIQTFPFHLSAVTCVF